MRIERISGAILILLSGVLLLTAAYGGTPEEQDATAILLTLPMGLVAPVSYTHLTLPTTERV